MHTDQQPGAATVLVVEDDPDVAFLLEYMLGRDGYQVLLCRDGKQAAAEIERVEPPALALLDIMLPYKDGFELVTLIRSKPEWNQVPIVMLTSKSLERDIVRALDAGASDYVVKPFQPGELMARLRRYLRGTKG